MEAYILKHNDFRTRISSRSGGAFTAISDLILDKGGVIYGVTLIDNIYARHIRVETVEGRNSMRGSKYIQSSIGDCYKKALEDLKNEKWVLFSGTPCQIAGLKTFLGKEYEKLLTVDIVCHGVPSPKVWRDYINYIEEKNNKKISGIDFRNKYKYGWAAHKETLRFGDDSWLDSGVFTNLFYSHNILRPCCFECPYKSLVRVSDFSIGDAWGIDKANPEFNDDNGVSIVLLNTEKARIFFGLMDSVTVKKVNIADYMQQPFQAPFDKPLDREKFWDYYFEHSFGNVVRKYKNITRINKVKKKILKKLHR